MSNIIDLRKHQLRTEEDVVEFFKFVEARIPQALKIMKDQHLKIASLQNNVRHYRDKQPAEYSPNVDSNVSVLDRLTNAPVAPAVSKGATRLQEMKNAQGTGTPATTAGPIVEPPTLPEPQTAPELPPPPVAPGEIGSLNVQNIQAHPPTNEPVPPPAPDEPLDPPQTAPAPVLDNEIFTYDGKSYSRARDVEGNLNYSAGGQNISSDEYNMARGQAMPEEEIAANAGTSKSEHAPNNDLQPQNPATDDGQLSQEEKDQLLNPAGPSEADKTSIGTSIAKKTKGKTNTKKKS